MLVNVSYRHLAYLSASGAQPDIAPVSIFLIPIGVFGGITTLGFVLHSIVFGATILDVTHR